MNSSNTAAETDSLLWAKTVNESSSQSPSSRSSIRAMSDKFLSQLSSRERDHVLEENTAIWPAARLIRDAVRGERSPSDWYDPNTDLDHPIRNFLSKVCARLVAYRGMNHFVQITAWILVLLSFVESPPWCQDNYLTITENTTVQWRLWDMWYHDGSNWESCRWYRKCPTLSQCFLDVVNSTTVYVC